MIFLSGKHLWTVLRQRKPHNVIIKAAARNFDTAAYSRRSKRQIWVPFLGGDRNDLVGGSTGDDSLKGELGNDALWGVSGNYATLGRDGDDQIGGGTGLESQIDIF